ncbi:MAG: hypothetical protein KF887_12540 [Paracoccaceae bacterium]|nr:MAG: hypothetical protein KF887_12540 [Paracoccaceae bacterium]
MRHYTRLVVLVSALALSACAGKEPASRGAAGVGLGVTQAATDGSDLRLAVPQYTVREVRVNVPRSLSVSEANLYYPVADIVWRGEPTGDRYMQVHQMFTEAFGFVTPELQTGPEVIVEAQVRRFHALTEKTRYTFGGVHSIRFDLTVKDAKTGAILDGPRFVVADTPASGGRKAIAEEQAGRTQRVVIIENLARVIRRELAPPPEAPALPAPVVGARAVPGADLPVGAVPVTLPPEPGVTQSAAAPATAPLRERGWLWSLHGSI